jgi:predicted AlkP superfamily pyrophosphatase or phosphodiesterase
VNAVEQRGKPYVVLVSFDGFRWDYQDLFSTPSMDRLAAAGVRAEALVPVFPTKTFPNHYSVATGQYPGRHGIVGNRFLDPENGAWYSFRDRSSVEDGRWYGGEPIWVTAETQGMVSAAFFFVGTEAAVQGVRPFHWNAFNYDITFEERVGRVLSWLAEPPATRPHFVTLYFEEPDLTAHQAGPDSPAVAEAVARVDAALGRLLDGIDRLPHRDQVYVVLVSDHGLGQVGDEVFVLDQAVDLEGVDVVGGGEVAFLHVREGGEGRIEALAQEIREAWPSGAVYRRGEAPTSWWIEDNPRFGDLILLADYPSRIVFSDWVGRPVNPGSHGWGPEVPEMHGIFLAMGPGLPAGSRIGRVSPVDVYPLLAKALGLEPAEAVQGDPDLLGGLIR